MSSTLTPRNEVQTPVGVDRQVESAFNAASRVTRRTILSAGGAGVIAVALGFGLRAAAATDNDEAAPFHPDLWIEVDGTGRVTITVHKAEMGQGVLTALPMLIADELEVAVGDIRVRQADADSRVANQNTAGSSSISESWEPLRRAGAVARIAFVQAAAAQWSVSPSECQARNGAVFHVPSGKRASYGSLVSAAALVELPAAADVDLKPPWEFRVIGKDVPRLDATDRVTGRHRYGLDVRVPGMLFAAVHRCPVLSQRVTTTDPAVATGLATARLLSVDLDAARRRPGVVAVLPLDEDLKARLPPRIAVFARSTWQALSALDALRATWDEGPVTGWSTSDISRRLKEAATLPPVVVRSSGTVGSQVRANPVHAAEFEVPFLAHATMEPMNCTAHVTGDHVEIWAPTQFPQRAVNHAARVLGIPAEHVRLHVVPMGGGFGRRVYADFVVEAVQASRAAGAPVQVVWSRQQDMRQDFYRPASFQRLAATLDDNGLPAAWLHELAGPSIATQTVPAGSAPPEDNEVDAAVNLPYAIPNIQVEWRQVPTPVPLGVWRSVAQSQNLFAVESFIDELAEKAGHDPAQYRRALLAHDPRLRNVLDLAVDAANFRERPPQGIGRGIALNKYGESTSVAVIATVHVLPDGTFRVERLTAAVDCGQPINALSLRAQIEGGLVWGLSAALHGKITLKDGRIEQSNFDDYPVSRIQEVPILDIHIVQSSASPGGIGEPCVPPVAPAIANALHAATGLRWRQQPFPEALALANR